MRKESQKFLYDLLKTPSPTGFEEQIQRIVRRRMKPFADKIETDYHGNVIVGLNTKAKRRVMLAGHCDQIGFMVRHIDKSGFLFVDRLGGIDPGVVPGSPVQVQGKKGILPGVFGRKPIHKQKSSERERMTLDLSKMWIDIGAKDKKEAEKLVEIGSPIVYEPRVIELGKDFIAGPGLDDRVGLFVVMEALRLCANAKLDVALYSVSTVQEEVGLRGAKTSAYSIDPDVGIAVDVTFASDNPGNDDAKEAPCKLGGGPGIYTGPNVSPVVRRLIETNAKKAKVPLQMLPSGTLLGNDANAMQVNRAGVAAASVGIPLRYMHTQVEVVSLKDLENSAKLLATLIKNMTSRTNLTPK